MSRDLLGLKLHFLTCFNNSLDKYLHSYKSFTNETSTVCLYENSTCDLPFYGCENDELSRFFDDKKLNIKPFQTFIEHTNNFSDENRFSFIHLNINYVNWQQ